MKRREDWKARLIAYLAASHSTPFQEGIHDCALFAAGAVEAMTGVDYAAPYRGRYKTTRGGYRILRKDGYADHVALCAACLPEIRDATGAPQPSMAQAGDITVLEGTDGLALGVVQGEWIYVLDAGRAHIGVRPFRDALRAFHVPMVEG